MQMIHFTKEHEEVPGSLVHVFRPPRMDSVLQPKYSPVTCSLTHVKMAVHSPAASLLPSTRHTRLRVLAYSRAPGGWQHPPNTWREASQPHRHPALPLGVWNRLRFSCTPTLCVCHAAPSQRGTRQSHCALARDSGEMRPWGCSRRWVNFAHHQLSSFTAHGL